jgi:hypothetical protein
MTSCVLPVKLVEALIYGAVLVFSPVSLFVRIHCVVVVVIIIIIIIIIIVVVVVSSCVLSH